MVGEDATLRCHLSPEKNAEDMEVRWFRTQFSPAVFVYKGRRERTDEQMEQYRGRTTFVSEAISEGSVGLIIHNVTTHENGIYCCYFQEGRSYDEAIMHLIVTGACFRFVRLLFHSLTLGESFSPHSRPAADQGSLCLEFPVNREGGFSLLKDSLNGFALLLWVSALETHTAVILSKGECLVPTDYPYAYF